MIDKVIIEQLSGLRSLYEWKSLEFTVAMKEGTGADTGGVNPLPHGKMLWTPATASRSAIFTFTGAVRKSGQPWDNCYIYNELNSQPLKADYFSLQMEFVANNKRPFEFELEYCEAGLAYNMAWQYKTNADDGGPGWRMFNKKTQLWEFFAGLPAVTAQAEFIAMKAYFSIDRAAQICTHEVLEVNGVLYTLGTKHAAVHVWKSTTNYLHQALQLDSDGRGTPLSVVLRNVNVRCI